MAHFIISYDLHFERHYQPVWNLLGRWGAVRLLESLWVATLDNTAAQVRDALRTVSDNDDSIAVIELKTADWACWKARTPGVEWLKKNL